MDKIKDIFDIYIYMWCGVFWYVYEEIKVNNKLFCCFSYIFNW